MKQTIEERLIRLEAGQPNLEKKLEGFRNDVNIRFSELRADINHRFDSVDTQFEFIDSRIKSIENRFDDLKFWLKLVFAAVVALLVAILIHWMIMWKWITKVVALVEDRLVLGCREEELQEIKRRIEKLEVSLMK